MAIDPLPRRAGLMEREHDFVTLPDIKPKELAAIARARGVVPLGDVSGFSGWLAAIGHHEGGHGFYVPIRQAVMAGVRARMTDADIIDKVSDAVLVAVKRPGYAAHNDYIARLQESIDGARRRRKRELIERDRADSKWATLEDGTAAIGAALGAFVKDAKRLMEPLEPEVDPLNLTDEQRKEFADYTQADWARHTLARANKNGERRRMAVHAINSTPGSGKSHQAAHAIIADLPPDLVVYFEVPSHENVDETVLKFPAGTAREERGRDRAELSADGLPMCHPEMHEQAAALEDAGLPVWDYLCKSDCQFRGKCGWSIQHDDKTRGVKVHPHEYGFLPGRTPDARVIDEAFWKAAIVKPTVNLAELMAAPPILPKRKKGSSEADTAIFCDGISRLKRALDAPDLNLDTLRAEGITSDLAREMVTFYHGLANSIADAVKPGMSAKDIRAGYAKFQNKSARPWAGIWTSIADQVDRPRSRWHGMRRWTGKDGEPLLMAARSKDIRNKHLNGQPIPTLLLDATADDEITRRFFPDLENITRVDIELGAGVTVDQVCDTPLPMARIALNEKYDTAKTIVTKNNGAAKLARLGEILASDGASVGAVTYKATEDRWKETDAFKHANGAVQTGHFGKLRGLNRFEKVDVLLTAGRNLTPEHDVELLAEAIFYKDDREIVPGKYGVASAHYETADGPVDCDTVCHPDDLVERVRWQLCEGEQLQGIHRARGIRRTAERPLRLIVASSVPIPLKVNRLVRYDDLIPNELETMATRAIVPESNSDAAAIYPDLFANAEAVKSAKEGAKSIGGNAYYKVYISESAHAFTATYQRAGNGQHRRKLTYDPARIPDIEKTLTASLGPLTFCRISEATETTNQHGEPKMPESTDSDAPQPEISPDPPRKPARTLSGCAIL